MYWTLRLYMMMKCMFLVSTFTQDIFILNVSIQLIVWRRHSFIHKIKPYVQLLLSSLRLKQLKNWRSTFFKASLTCTCIPCKKYFHKFRKHSWCSVFIHFPRPVFYLPGRYVSFQIFLFPAWINGYVSVLI